MQIVGRPPLVHFPIVHCVHEHHHESHLFHGQCVTCFKKLCLANPTIAISKMLKSKNSLILIFLRINLSRSLKAKSDFLFLVGFVLRNSLILMVPSPSVSFIFIISWNSSSVMLNSAMVNKQLSWIEEDYICIHLQIHPFKKSTLLIHYWSWWVCWWNNLFAIKLVYIIGYCFKSFNFIALEGWIFVNGWICKWMQM